MRGIFRALRPQPGEDVTAPSRRPSTSCTYLYFFYDIDVEIVVVEIADDDLDLRQVQDTLYRFGRA
ncbi:hypothetical protein E4Q08_17045 [Candidatus Accumulibacter phosphatis]|uniref:Uncharacterized protein n=1 Tax=Candidatus Accumulibacter contiguus TaxID=2954381 RepID=A0ABX1TCY0_9PROT|nr:hypothetical protein [Candidatus Accumulibacter contiguus]NMQ06831.1 hypothetical protein [Candidatus Accumulibacter contiguus]